MSQSFTGIGKFEHNRNEWLMIAAHHLRKNEPKVVFPQRVVEFVERCLWIVFDEGELTIDHVETWAGGGGKFMEYLTASGQPTHRYNASLVSAIVTWCTLAEKGTRISLSAALVSLFEELRSLGLATVTFEKVTIFGSLHNDFRINLSEEPTRRYDLIRVTSYRKLLAKLLCYVAKHGRMAPFNASRVRKACYIFDELVAGKFDARTELYDEVIDVPDDRIANICLLQCSEDDTCQLFSAELMELAFRMIHAVESAHDIVATTIQQLLCRSEVFGQGAELYFDKKTARGSEKLERLLRAEICIPRKKRKESVPF